MSGVDKTQRRIPVYDPGGSLSDAKMPMLALALDPAHMAHALRKQVESPGSDLAERAWDLQAIHVRRHKPGRRCLIEYELAEPTSRSRLSILGKIRAKGLDLRSYEVQEALWHQGFDSASDDGISVSKPLGFLPHLAMWLQKKVRARPVIENLDKEGALALAERISEAVHKLHRLGPLPDRNYSMEDELRILQEQLTALAQRHPAWENRITAFLAACAQLGRSLPAGPPCPSQRDCYHDNILFDGSRLYLVDLDLYCLADPGLDVGNCIAHLIDYSLRCHKNQAHLGRVIQTLKDRFAALTGQAHERQVAVYTALSLARLVAISTRIPGREHWTAPLMDLCELRLKELQP